MDPSSYLASVRSYAPSLPPVDVLIHVTYINDPTLDDDDWNDPTGDFREAVCILIDHDLRLTDRALLLYMLEQEIANHRANWGIIDNIQRCAFLVAKLGFVEDVILLWTAKEASFDTACAMDGHLLVGAGVQPTLAYLRTLDDAVAADIVDAIEYYVADGTYDNLARYFAREYRATS